MKKCAKTFRRWGTRTKSSSKREIVQVRALADLSQAAPMQPCVQIAQASQAAEVGVNQ